MQLTLNEIRIKLDQHAERIVSGLKDRSRYPLNEGVFTKSFFEGKTWFEYRLLKEQGLDAEFGRYNFHGQTPLLFPVSSLPQSLGKRLYPEKDSIVVSMDLYPKIMPVYKKTIEAICKPGEEPSSFGETAKTDVANILALNERIRIGEDVAAAKIQAEPGLLYLEKEALRNKLRNVEREKEVIVKGVAIAERYFIENAPAVGDLFRNIIEITLDLEEAYVAEARRLVDSQPRLPISWSNSIPSNSQISRVGFGI